MSNTKDIQRRIKSIGNTKKITRAMEMVAAAKMRKAVEAALATRSYANLSWETLLRLTATSAEHPLFETRKEVKRQAIIVITSNRGLCGGFNSALLNLVRAQADQNTELILVGRKGETMAANFSVAAEFEHPETALDAQTVLPIVRFVSEGFLSKRYDKIFIAYTDFINVAKQVPRLRQILPIVIEASEKKSEYLFEPDAGIVLAAVVPRLLEIQLYQAFLESIASEHSARMAAMHQATEAASDLAIELTLFYNKARQAAITSEIAEITAGVAAQE